jgi:hypothetical protein
LEVYKRGVNRLEANKTGIGKNILNLIINIKNYGRGK